MAEKTAKFRFLGYKITNAQIKVDEGMEISKKFNVNFERTESVSDEEHKMRLNLSTKIDDENKAMHIEIKASGIFEFDNDISDAERNTFFRTSAPAILFPYIRAYVGTLSSLSGIRPVILPTLNLSKR